MTSHQKVLATLRTTPGLRDSLRERIKAAAAIKHTSMNNFLVAAAARACVEVEEFEIIKASKSIAKLEK